MNNSKLSFPGVLGCFVFDLALILAFFKAFGLFSIIAADKSIIMLIVLIMGLIIFNGTVIFPNILFKRLGIQYSTSTTLFLLLYAVLANILSIYLLQGSTIWYIIWELIVFSVFVITFSKVTVVSKDLMQNISKAEKEQADKTSIALQLLEIERILTAKENQEDIIPSLNLFIALKERIQASTPFGRISFNSAVLEIENQIRNNLLSLQDGFQGNLIDKNRLFELQRLLEDTRRLVINRETLNIK